MEPAVGLDRLGGGRGVVPVALEDLGAREHELAVGGNLDGCAREGLADGADLDRVGAVDRRRRRCFSEAVALEDDDADAAEEVAEAIAERRATGDGPLDLAAHRRAQLAVDEPVEDLVLELQAEAGAAGVEGLGVVDGGLGGSVEDVALALGGRLLLRRVEDLLEDARDSEEEGRLEGLQVAQQVLDVGGVPEARARVDAAQLDDAAEDVGEGQEEQGGRALDREELGHAGDDVAHLEHEVAVRKHAALGPPGRARGVDDRGERLRVEGRAAALELFVRDAGAGGGEGVECAVVEDPRPRAVREAVGYLVEDLLVLGTLEEHADRVGVAEDPLDLLSGGGLVDRHDRGAGVPDGVVRDRPVVARARHDADALAGLDAGGDDALGHGLDLVEELLGGHAHPGAPAIDG